MCLVVGLSAMPTRFATLQQMLRSLGAQTRRPDLVVLSTPVQQAWGGEVAQLVRHGIGGGGKQRPASLDAVSNCADRGPGSKLLCTLERLSRLPTSGGGGAFPPRNSTYIVLADDDMRYDRGALSSMEQHWRAHPGSAASFYTYQWNPLAKQQAHREADRPKGLSTGQGSDLFGLPLSALDGVTAWADCIMGQDPMFFYHDDVWISMWLALRKVRLFALAPPNTSGKTSSIYEKINLLDDQGLANHHHTSLLYRPNLSKRLAASRPAAEAHCMRFVTRHSSQSQLTAHSDS
jgi:hypothetical protein